MKHFTVCLLLAASYAFAQRGPATEPPAARVVEGPATPIPPETNSVTDHELSLDGKTIHYSATAGTLLIDGDDAKPYATSGNYSNWELSADRANAARRLLHTYGVRPQQVVEVRGYADQKLLDAQDPQDPKNRRVSLVVRFSGEGGN